MNAKELVKKLGNKILGKKVNTSAAGDVETVIPTAAQMKMQEIMLLDGLGVIRLHENWRN